MGVDLHRRGGRKTDGQCPTDSTLLQDGVRVVTGAIHRAKRARGTAPVRNRRAKSRGWVSQSTRARGPKTCRPDPKLPAPHGARDAQCSARSPRNGEVLGQRGGRGLPQQPKEGTDQDQTYKGRDMAR
jgi:hypothetical protein